MIREIISYVLGGIGLVLVCYSLFSKKKTNFLLIQVIANAFYGGSYIAIEAYVAGIITLVSILRCVFLYFAEKKEFKYTHYVLPIFVLAYVGIVVGFWASWFDIIPLITATLYTYSFAIRNIQTSRYVMLIPTTGLLVYNCIVGAYVNGATMLVEFVSTIVAIIIYHKRNKQEKKKEVVKEKVENEEKTES